MDGNWNGEEVANMYKGPLLQAMKEAYPNKAKKEPWVVLEENDPAGYKSYFPQNIFCQKKLRDAAWPLRPCISTKRLYLSLGTKPLCDVAWPLRACTVLECSF